MYQPYLVAFRYPCHKKAQVYFGPAPRYRSAMLRRDQVFPSATTPRFGAGAVVRMVI